MMRHMMRRVSGHAHDDYGDKEAEVLIFHHLMMTRQKPTTRLDDCWLQKNIYQTSCTSSGKLCTILVWE